MPNTQQEFISSILLEAAKHGGNGLPLTALLKFLYLLDVHCAEASGGKACTGFRWRFHHYGPYAGDAVDLTNQLVDRGVVERIEVERVDREFSLLSWRATQYGMPLEKLEVPLHARSTLANDIRRFRFDLPGLLSHVYFNTAPMENAAPGDDLTFDQCLRVRVEDVKPRPLKPIPPKAAARARQLLDSMESRYRLASVSPIRPHIVFDGHYTGSAPIETNERSTQYVVKASLTFPSRHGKE